MSAPRTAAAKEEEAQLNDLRDRADQATAEAAQALAEMSRRVSAARRPGETARRLTADARAAAVSAVRQWTARAGGRRPAQRVALAVIPVCALAIAAAYLKFSHPERLRAFAPSRR